MKELLNPNDHKCPSCGQPKKNNKGEPAPEYLVCYYCWVRGDLSNLKLFILYVLNEIDRPVTVYELCDIMNTHPALKGRCTFIRERLKNSLEKMTRPKNKLILKGHRKNRSKNGGGRKLNTYKIGKRNGVKYLERYLDKWDRGMIVHLKPKKVKSLKRFFYNPEHSSKSISIWHKLKKGQYDRFDFLFVKDLKKSIDAEDK